MSDRVFSGAPWEKTYGYCRAVRMGPVVAVSGTTSVKDGRVIHAGDPAAQTERCLQIIEESLRPFGLNRTNIIRTRMYVTDISKADVFGRAHGAFFQGTEPASSMIGINALVAPELMIEIEADAVVPTPLS